MKTLFLLFYEFFKTGLFSVGGGMATLPFLYEMSSKHPEWFSAAQLADMIAVSESTPGPIGVNMATYAGFNAAGIVGSIFATIGLIFPEIIVILIISKILDRFRQNKYVDAAFKGIRPCSVALISAAGLLVAKIALLYQNVNVSGTIFGVLNVKAIILFLIVLIFTRYVKFTKKLHPVYFLAFSAVAGIVFKF